LANVVGDTKVRSSLGEKWGQLVQPWNAASSRRLLMEPDGKS
jgi:hypothetical protein